MEKLTTYVDGQNMTVSFQVVCGILCAKDFLKTAEDYAIRNNVKLKVKKLGGVFIIGYILNATGAEKAVKMFERVLEECCEQIN